MFPAIILADYLDTFSRGAPKNFLGRANVSPYASAIIYAFLLFLLPCAKTLTEQGAFLANAPLQR